MSDPLIVATGPRKTYRRRVRGSGRRQEVGGRHSQHVVTALDDVSFTVSRSELVGYIGPNGAGKSTFLRSIAGLVTNTADTISYRNIDMAGQAVSDIVGHGIAMVPEGRKLFPSLSVEENLLIGGYSRRAGTWSLDRVYNMFPILNERKNVPGTALSGGEQQMTAIGRALMANPSVILLDEPSMGLAPQLVEEIFEIVKRLNQEEGVSILLAEQNVTMALRYADHGYILENGRVVMDGAAAELSDNEDVKEFYLGLGGGARKSFRDVKHYRRRKRWLG